jgi:transposase
VGHNGFWLWYRRLERERFRWPQSDAAALEVSARELRWLLDGLDISQVKGHRKADFRLL